MSAARLVYPEPVKTRYGDGYLLGYDGLGQACVTFHKGAAPELEAQRPPLRGISFTQFIPAEDVLREETP